MHQLTGIRYLKDTSGGFAVWFAVVSMLLALAAGVAIDVNHAHRAEAYLQDLTDSAALAAARESGKSEKEKRKIARAFIKNAFDRNYDLNILRVKLKEKKDGTIKVVSTAKINTMMMSLIGRKTIKIKARSEVNQQASGGPVEITFVLDTTASMNAFGAQWSSVVNALEDLMLKLSDNGTGNKEDFRASLIPFSDRVRLGNNKLKGNPQEILPGCANTREENIGGNPNKLTNKTPKQLPITGGYMGWGCPNVAAVFPTHDIHDLIGPLKSISPQGTGRFDEGLVWGYRMLSNDWRTVIGGGDWPNKNKVTKVAVFLTDGYSTIYEYEVLPHAHPRPWGWNKGTPEGFANVLDVCNQMKSDNIVIYVIAVNINVHFKPYLQKCASGADKYFTVSNAGQVIDVIGSIGTTTSDLRLTK